MTPMRAWSMTHAALAVRNRHHLLRPRAVVAVVADVAVGLNEMARYRVED